MKKFFEEYGFVILSAIVVILLIAMATPIGDLVKIQVSEVVNSFGSKTQSKLNATDGIIQVRVSTANNKITLEWEAIKKEDVFKYSYKASNTKDEANWTNKADVTANEKSRTVTINKDSNDQPLANKTKVEYKIYDSNDQLVASGVVTAKVGKSIDGGSGGTGGDPDGGSTENPSAPTVTLTAGQKITVANKEYTVIEQVEGSKYKVLAEYQSYDKGFNTQEKGSVYENSIVDNYLSNDYYNNLPETIRSAIVEQNISQTEYSANAFEFNLGRFLFDFSKYIDSKSIGTRKVFLPSAKELSNVVNVNDEKEMDTFLKDSNGNFYRMWLRDKCGSNALFADYNLRSLVSNGVWGTNFSVRPAFVLDLSKVRYEKVK